MGFDMTEGKVSRWLKKIGDPVTRNETIGEIETEKATVDLTAPVDGIFAQILVQPGETVPVNTPIAVLAAQGESVGAPPPASPAESQSPEPKPSAAQQPATLEKQIEGAPPTATETPTQETGKPAAPQPTAQTDSVPPPPVASPNGGRVKASPLAKNIARAEGIDLAALAGTGPNGRIIGRDVQAFLETRAPSAPAAPAAKPAPVSAPVVAPTPTQLVAGEQPLSKMRQVIARRLQESKSTIPHFYLTMEIYMDEAMKLRGQVNAMAGSDEEKLSVNDLIVAAVGRTLRKFPNVNAYFKGDKLEMHDAVNVGIAVSVDDGLLTPVLHNADQKSLKQIAVETKALAARARANKMQPQDLGPGTFTISNLGMYGIDEFAAIINPPESSILAVGMVKKVPVVLNDQIQVAQVMKLTMSVDHRVVDGALGARFMQELKKLLENPINLVVS